MTNIAVNYLHFIFLAGKLIVKYHHSEGVLFGELVSDYDPIGRNLLVDDAFYTNFKTDLMADFIRYVAFIFLCFLVNGEFINCLT